MTTGVTWGTTSSQTVRNLVEEVIREGAGGSRLNLWAVGSAYNVGGVTQRVQQLASARSIAIGPEFWRVVIEHIWMLARIGALALMPQDPQIVGGMVPEEQRQIPTFIVTDLGRRLLNEPNFSPQDWEKFKAATLLRVESAPDEVVVTYLAESVGTWRAMQYRASVVMLGCACERLIIMLAEAVRDASITTFSTKVKGALESARPTPISTVYEHVRKPLVEPTNPARLPSQLRDAIDRRLSGIFDHARRLRNAHGHPTGEDVSREDAEIALRMFPSFYELVDKLVQHLRTTFNAAAGVV